MSYFKNNIFDADLQVQLKRQEEYVKKLKKNKDDPSDSFEAKFVNTVLDRMENMFKEPDLAELIGSCYPQSDRMELVKKVIEKLLQKYEKKDAEFKYDRIIRIVTALLTEAVVTAPLDGIDQITIDPTENFGRISFAGPIRATGGTIQGLIVVIAEYLAKKLGLSRYVPTVEQVQRGVSQCMTYCRLRNTQGKKPSTMELEHIIRNSYIMIDGTESENEEVLTHKYLPRIKKPRIRGGMCLVIIEGLLVRAPKIHNYLKQFDIDNKSNQELMDMMKDEKSTESSKQDQLVLTIGRPLISLENKSKGLKLRIGTTPTIGLCSCNVHPSLIKIIKFINIGSQLVVSLPGKGTTIGGLCEDLNPPIVKYKDGGVREYEGNDQNIEKIMDLGEILFCSGEFIEYKKQLPLRDYCNGQFRRDTNYEVDPLNLSEVEIVEISKKYPRAKIVPKYGLYLNSLSFSQYLKLREGYKTKGYFEVEGPWVGLLDKLVVPYSIEEGKIILKYKKIFEHYMFLDELFTYTDYVDYVKEIDVNNSYLIQFLNFRYPNRTLLCEKGRASIKARVGRAQSVNMTKMKQKGTATEVHSLCEYNAFKSDTENFWQSLKKHKYSLGNFELRYCENCKQEKIYSKCDCGAITIKKIYCKSCNIYVDLEEQKVHKEHSIKKKLKVKRDLQKEIQDVRSMELIKNTKIIDYKKNMRCKKCSTATPYPEPLIKGILRSKYRIPVSKDGTFRIVNPNLATTHFRIREIGITLEEANKLGYVNDEKGVPYNLDSIIPLNANDVIISYKAADYLLKGFLYLDELVQTYYDQKEPYLDPHSYKDLLGVLLYSISPHTSNGVVNRIIGFIENYGVYAHPLVVVARRRDLDGDIDAYGPLLDLGLNGSMEYVSKNRTGALMSIPLSLSTKFLLDQVGKEILEREVCSDYYDAFDGLSNNRKYKPIELKKISRVEDFVSKGLSEKEYLYNTPRFILTNYNSKNLYRDLGSSVEKVSEVIKLMNILPDVNPSKTATGLIEGHLLPDIIGNLNAYFRQKLKCDYCKKIFNVNPLTKKCLYCNIGNMKYTVYPGMVTKYLKIINQIRSNKDIKLSNVLQQRICNYEKILKGLFTTKNALTDLLDKYNDEVGFK